MKTGGGFKQCFNDVLGFRLHFEQYMEEYPEYYRVVDLRNGKQVDDRWIYKYDNADIGKKLYDLYIKGEIKTEEDFLERLKEERGKV